MRVRRDGSTTLRSARLSSRVGAARPRTEDRAAHPHHRRALGDRRPRSRRSCPSSTSRSPGRRSSGARGRRRAGDRRGRRHGHQSLDAASVRPARVDERGAPRRARTPLLRLTRHVDLHEHRGAGRAPADLGRELRRGRPTATARPRRDGAHLVALQPPDEVPPQTRRRDVARAPRPSPTRSWARFSPRSTAPAAIAARTSSRPTSLVTTTSVTASGSRPGGARRGRDALAHLGEPFATTSSRQHRDRRLAAGLARRAGTRSSRRESAVQTPAVVERRRRRRARARRGSRRGCRARAGRRACAPSTPAPNRATNASRSSRAELVARGAGCTGRGTRAPRRCRSRAARAIAASITPAASPR